MNKIASIFCIYFVGSASCWDLILEHGGIVYQDLKYINAYINITRYNKTVYVIKGEGDIHKEFPCSAEVAIKLYGEFTNTYKVLPLQITRTLNNVYKYEYKFIAKEIGQHTNLPEDCPVKKGHYYIKDFSPNLNAFKQQCPVVPWATKKYIFEYKLSDKKKTFFWVQLYIQISKDDEYKVV